MLKHFRIQSFPGIYLAAGVNEMKKMRIVLKDKVVFGCPALVSLMLKVEKLKGHFAIISNVSQNLIFLVLTILFFNSTQFLLKREF